MRVQNFNAKAFSLVELLVVIAIIIVLIAILLPVISRAREGARAVVCLSNLQQCDHLYQLYLSANHNHSIESQMQGWWVSIAPNASDIAGVLRCPDAAEPRSNPAAPTAVDFVAIAHGTAASAWIERTSTATTVGSYGFNFNLLGHAHLTPSGFFSLPASQPQTIPAFCDCIFSRVIFASTRDDPPHDLIDPEEHNGIPEVCLNRHQKAVNVAFLDGHAERVPLAALWQLKWSPDSTPRNVSVP